MVFFWLYCSFSLLSKFVLFTKLAILLLLAKFARFNLKPNISFVNLLNFGEVTYLSWLWSVSFFSISLIFVLQSVFFVTRLLTLDILFSTAVRYALVAQWVILGISYLISFIWELRVALVAKLVISGILYSIFFHLSIIYIFFNDIIFCYIA